MKADEASVEEALKNLAATAQDFKDRKAGVKAKNGDCHHRLQRPGGWRGIRQGSGEDHPLVLGSSLFIPGFEAQLVGAAAGDEVSVNVTFPEAYGAAHLAGKAAVFACTVKAVKAGCGGAG